MVEDEFTLTLVSEKLRNLKAADFMEDVNLPRPVTDLFVSLSTLAGNAFISFRRNDF